MLGLFGARGIMPPLPCLLRLTCSVARECGITRFAKATVERM